MEFHGVLFWFNGDWMGFDGDFMVMLCCFNADWMGFDGDFMLI